MGKQLFSVQPFRKRGKSIEAENIREVSDEAAALRLGERLASTKAGVIVAKQMFDSELGEYGDAVVLAIHGQVPPGYGPAGFIPF